MKAKNKKQQQNVMMIAGVTVGAIIIAAVAMFVSGSSLTSGNIDYSQIHQERTSDGAFILGDPDAPITLVYFADFLCPACQQYKPTVDRFMEEFVVTGMARFEYRMLPTQGANSVNVAKMAECAGDLAENGFWPAHDELFVMASGSTRIDNMGRELADRMGFSYADLLECTARANQVNVDQGIASNNGANSTPSLRVRYNNSAQMQAIGAQGGGLPFSALENVVRAANELP